MYLRYFGLKRLPFESVSNATAYVDLPEHTDALNTVLFGLKSGEGFVKVVGEVGTGKTALCRNLLSCLDNDCIAVYIPNPRLTPHDLLLTISDELGVPLPPGGGMHQFAFLATQWRHPAQRQGLRFGAGLKAPLTELFAQLFGGKCEGAGQAISPDIFEPHKLSKTPLKGRGLYRSGGAMPAHVPNPGPVQCVEPTESARRCPLIGQNHQHPALSAA